MAWADVTYAYKKKITLNHAQVQGDETDFPVLIYVTDNDLRDEANGGHVKSASGYDIVFYNGAEDTLLKHEIEKYTNTDGKLVYWVKVPSISSSAPSTEIYIYYGKVGVVVDPSTTDTWDGDFIAVYHLTDLEDSTSNNNDGVNQGADATVGGKIPDCHDFIRANTDWVNIDAVNNDVDVTKGTMEVWANLDNWASGNYECFICLAANSDARIFISHYTDNTIQWWYWYKSHDYGAVSMDCSGLNGWHKFTLTWDTSGNGQIRAFYDGDLEATDDSVDVFPSALNDSQMGEIYGDSIGHSTQWLDGYLDEARISGEVRSDNWIKTSHNTQDSPGTFCSWGGEESQSGDVGSDVYYYDGSAIHELVKDDTSPVKLFNGTVTVGIKIVAVDDANASPIHVFDGTNIKALKKM